MVHETCPREEEVTARVLVTGSRYWTDEATINEWLWRLPPTAIIAHGDCRGADKIADRIARHLGLTVEKFPVDHAIDGPFPGAGPRRNGRMIDAFKPTRGLAFPRFDRMWEPEGGTWDCMKQMWERTIPVTVCPPGSRP